MAIVTIKLDTRRVRRDGKYNIIYRIRYLKKVYTINSEIAILEEFWNYNSTTVNSKYPNAKLINIKLLKGFVNIEKAILILEDDFTIIKLKSLINGEPSINSKSFKCFTEELIDQMLAINKTGNALVYQTALNRFLDFCKKDILFHEIDYILLNRYKHHLELKGLKQNSISNYFRTIKAIYNKAIKHKLIERSQYPFYDISIKSQKTANRAISSEDIQCLNTLTLKYNSQLQIALNYFMLSFYLRGMSFTDMAYLKHCNINNGRIAYTRRKTHKNYSVKLFYPAKTIISAVHKENNKYLLPVLSNDIIEDSLDAKRTIKQWIKTTNKYLKISSKELELDTIVTTYSSRYTFANIAKQLGYSNELISEALGHSYGNKTTGIYLDNYDNNYLDEMHLSIIEEL